MKVLEVPKRKHMAPFSRAPTQSCRLDLVSTKMSALAFCRIFAVNASKQNAKVRGVVKHKHMDPFPRIEK